MKVNKLNESKNKLYDSEFSFLRSNLPPEYKDEDIKIALMDWLNENNKINLNELRSVVAEKFKKITLPEETTSVNRGDVECKIRYRDGYEETKLFKANQGLLWDKKNTLLRNGKVAWAKSLANDIEDPYDFYITSMVFGSNGATASTPKYVDESRTGLFGTTLLTKNVISSIDEAAPTTTIFTSVIAFDEAVGNVLNEMALKMKNGQLYSMLTFPDLNKTSQFELIFNWRISIL